MQLPQVKRILAKFPQARVLVIGDLMLDEFLWGTVERISPEAPVPVVRIERESVHLGGAANVAHNLRALGARVTVCGVLGTDRAGDRVIEEPEAIGADPSGVVRSRAVVTTRKTRVIAHHQQVVRFDREHYEHPPATTRRLVDFLRHHAGRFDAVLVSDYAKGAVSGEVLECLSELHRSARWPLVIDPKKPNFGRYRGATLMTPNQAEASDAAGIPIRDDGSLQRAGERLLDTWKCDAVLITRGEQGMSLFSSSGPPRHFPTRARDVFDVTGAGDTVVAVCALALATGASMESAVWLANAAAGIVVGKLGTATTEPREILAAVAGDGTLRRERKPGGRRA